MPCRLSFWRVLAAVLIPAASPAADVTAGVPIERSVTIYRPPFVRPQSLDLDGLAGFALVSETRRIDLPAGESRIRFEGVANGIEPETALISGLPSGIVEKNEDARVLSPAELVASAVGRTLTVVRTHPKTGQSTRIPGVIRSDAQGGVVFQSAEGIEALRCSGMPETFRFEARTDLSAAPTLSVLVDTAAATSVTVTLSYLAAGFDWTADYVATLSGNGRTIDLGAWVTLANSNDVSFPSAQTQVVAGRLNRVEEASANASGRDLPHSSTILARCWPAESEHGIEVTGADDELRLFKRSVPAPRAIALEEMVVTAQRRTVEQEQLGDLKLYRVPEATDVLSRQMKQVRLLDRSAIPVVTYYRADLRANQESASVPAGEWLRTKNDTPHHLGLPLPSGRINLFAPVDDSSLLIGQAALHDTAVNEELDLEFGVSPDVRLRSTTYSTTITPDRSWRVPPNLRRVRRFKSATVDHIQRIEIVNARASPIPMELHLLLQNNEQLIRSDQTPVVVSGRPVFKLTVPANETVAIRYQTEHTEQAIVR
jgi:hypothetical protein